MADQDSAKQNITISLTRRTLQKARVLAARRKTSISGLLTEQLEQLVKQDEAYAQAHQTAMALLQQGSHLSGAITVTRDVWHER